MSEARSPSAEAKDQHVPIPAASVAKLTPPVKGSPTSKATTQKRTRLPIALALSALLASALFLLPRDNSTNLPASYALCSREGNIYTVDDSKPRVECCVVHRGRIADTGSICMTHHFIPAFNSETRPAEVRKRWGDRDHTGPVAESPPSGTKNGLKFVFVNRGSIVVPGLAGTYQIVSVSFPHSCRVDAHAHILEYGFKRQLELDGSDSLQGQ